MDDRISLRQGMPSLAELPRIFAAAPHRMMFFAGAAAVLVSMAWWACVLCAGYAGLAMPAPPVPAGWAHAVFAQYGMLAPFIFGFLLTVFPRWMAQSPLTKRHYVPVFAGLFGGYLLAHVGLLGLQPVFVAGLMAMLCGWTFGVLQLGRALLRNRAQDRHALVCWLALVFGAFGLAAFAAFALGAPWQFAMFSIKTGTYALLVPIYFTVCHRMVPFFSANIVGPGYRAFRPEWAPLTVMSLAIAHGVLEGFHEFSWLWCVDIPLVAIFLLHWFRWQPWRCLAPGLLAVLHAAFVWLPLGFALFAVQSLVLDLTGNYILGRAPVHAVTVGYFGSMLVAMVTRVTQGHSGRPLAMGVVPWITFGALQVVALVRMIAEVAPNPSWWLVLAAIGWLVAFAPWVVRSAWIYLTPRADGRIG
jgi:uncharacterized protein involved in response to NO